MAQLGVLRHPAFARFWAGSTLGAFGGAIGGVAVQVLIVTELGATPLEIGLLNATQVVPYVFLGLIVGALMDRWKRKPTLVVSSLVRAVLLASIPALWIADALTIGSLAVILLLLGVAILLGESASQPFLPRIVERRQLVEANSRLAQSTTVATTVGPAAGGAVLSGIAAPFVMLMEATAHLVAGALFAVTRVVEPVAQARPVGRNIGHDILDGMRYTYRHRTLAPLAISTHFWFLANSVAITVFAPFALREIGLDPLAFGLALAFAGLGGFVGAAVAPWAGRVWGAGGAVLVGRALVAIPWVVLAAAPVVGDCGILIAAAIVSLAQVIYGFGMGLEDPNEAGYRQAVAPDDIQGRLNATIRTVNRVTLLVGAILGGVLATVLGFRVSMAIAAAVFLIAAGIVAFSPFRTARYDDSV